MKAFLKHFWLCGGGIASLVALCSTAVHPYGSVKGSEWRTAGASDLHIAPEVAPLLKRSCMDCHSNRTLWPWYSYMAPMSWLVERDVRLGRDHMNFSEWDQYDFKQREKLLADIASAVKNREMPLRQYTLVHRDAKLSDVEIDVLYGWARAERRRLKATAPTCDDERRPTRRQALMKKHSRNGNISIRKPVLGIETHADSAMQKRRKQCLVG